MNKLKFLYLLFLCLLFTSCSNLFNNSSTNSSTKSKPLTDQRFTGTFVYYNNFSSYDGTYESEWYETYTFDGTSFCTNYCKYSIWEEGKGWSFSGDSPGDAYEFEKELEVNNGFYRMRLWENPYDDWDSWEKYEFSYDGATQILKLKNRVFYKYK